MTRTKPRPVEVPVTKTVRYAGDKLERTETTHPAFGQIAASRVTSGGGAVLYASDFKHGGFMSISISRSTLMRDLSRDWHYAHDELIRVELTEAQWATFVSTPNSGQGVPCTIDRIAYQPEIPLLPPPVDRHSQFAAEVRTDIDRSLARLDALLARLDEVKVGAKVKEELINEVRLARQDIASGIPFVAKSFDEHVEQTVEKAKIEVHAYVSGAVQRAGLAAIAAGHAPPLLFGGDEPPTAGVLWTCGHCGIPNVETATECFQCGERRAGW